MNLERRKVVVDVWEKETNFLALSEIPVEYLKEEFYLNATTYDGDKIFYIEHHRLETDEEYNARLESYNQQFKNQQQREYQEYLKLKAKFEGNGESN